MHFYTAELADDYLLPSADIRAGRAIQLHFSPQVVSLRFQTSQWLRHLSTTAQVRMQYIDA